MVVPQARILLDDGALLLVAFDMADDAFAPRLNAKESSRPPAIGEDMSIACYANQSVITVSIAAVWY
jgi:hypothetical protein